MPKRLLVSALALVALMAASPARAHDLAPFLRDHRDLPQVQRLIVLHERLHRMIARYEALERQAGHTWIEVVDAEHDVADALATSDAAEADLAARVRAAYQFGAGGAVEALLSAGSFADAATISEYTARTITLRNDVLRDSSVAQAVVVAKRAEAQARRSSLEPELDVLRRLMMHMQATVNEATDLAREAAIADDVLQAQRALVAAAAARMGTWDLIGYQDDQSPLLTLLGPTGGRTCDTPEGPRRPARCSTATRRGTGGSSAVSRRRPGRSSTRGCSPRRAAPCPSARSSGCRTEASARSCSSMTAGPTAAWNA
jgi:hypothetical protein